MTLLNENENENETSFSRSSFNSRGSTEWRFAAGTLRRLAIKSECLKNDVAERMKMYKRILGYEEKEEKEGNG